MSSLPVVLQLYLDRPCGTEGKEMISYKTVPATNQ